MTCLLRCCSCTARLSDQGQDALCISHSLHVAAQEVREGSCTAVAQLQRQVSQRITAAGGKVDYMEVSRCVCVWGGGNG
jgi:pantothenate synthetase